MSETAIATVGRSHKPIESMSFDDMLRMGESLVRTGFLPQHIKTGAQAAAIILTGRELGMMPMQAIRSLQIVRGKVSENADSQLARFKEAGGKARFDHLDANKAVLWLQHPNGDEHIEVWTIDDAKAAGLLESGSMHRKFPKAMNRSRVITAGLKSIGWVGAVGAYDPDEIGLVDNRPTQQSQTQSAIREGEIEEPEPGRQASPEPEPAVFTALREARTRKDYDKAKAHARDAWKGLSEPNRVKLNRLIADLDKLDWSEPPPAEEVPDAEFTIPEDEQSQSPTPASATAAVETSTGASVPSTDDPVHSEKAFSKLAQTKGVTLSQGLSRINVAFKTGFGGMIKWEAIPIEYRQWLVKEVRSMPDSGRGAA